MFDSIEAYVAFQTTAAQQKHDWLKCSYVVYDARTDESHAGDPHIDVYFWVLPYEGGGGGERAHYSEHGVTRFAKLTPDEVFAVNEVASLISGLAQIELSRLESGRFTYVVRTNNEETAPLRSPDEES